MKIHLYVLPTADKTLGRWMYWVWDDLPTQQTWRLQFQSMSEYGIMLASFPGLHCFVLFFFVLRFAFSFHGFRSGKAERKRTNKKRERPWNEASIMWYWWVCDAIFPRVATLLPLEYLYDNPVWKPKMILLRIVHTSICSKGCIVKLSLRMCMP